MQTYSRLFESGTADFLAPCVLMAAHSASVPVCYHLDHGIGLPAVVKSLRLGCTGIMSDSSSLPLEENIAATRQVVELCRSAGVPVEGELGHIGTTKDEITNDYTGADEALRFVRETGVVALAIHVGTAHGRYKQAPRIAVERISEIYADLRDKVPDRFAALVLHGGSGIPDDQVHAAIEAGIRKVNFGTDICYTFLDAVFDTTRDVIAIDLFMKNAVKSVKNFALEKIHLLGAENKS